MANKSHSNSGHMAMNKLKKEGVAHSSFISTTLPSKTFHGIFIDDSVKLLKQIPDLVEHVNLTN